MSDKRLDFASIIGFLGGIVTLLIFFSASGGRFSSVISFPSIMFILVGTFSITLAGVSLTDCKMLWSLLRDIFIKPVDRTVETLSIFAQAAKTMRRGGLLALEQMLPTVENETIKKGMELIVNRINARQIRDFIGDEGDRKLANYQMGIRFFQKMGGFSPTLGIIGTVLGLMSALSNLSDFSQVGGAIAEAFVATMWGVAFANLFCFPLANKLEYRRRKEEENLEIILDGLLSVQRGSNSFVMEEKIMAYKGIGFNSKNNGNIIPLTLDNDKLAGVSMS